MPRVRGAPGGPEAAEDLRHLELRPGHVAGSGRRRCSQVEPLERALDLADGAERDPGVARGRGDVPVAQEALDHPDVDCRRKARMSPLSKAEMSASLPRHRSWESVLG